MSSLEASLKDPTRPTFLHGLTPPLDSTTPDAARTPRAPGGGSEATKGPKRGPWPEMWAAVMWEAEGR